jgi:hypothetical protein
MDKLKSYSDIEGLDELIKTNPVEAVRVMVQAGGLQSSAMTLVAVARDEWDNEQYLQWAEALYKPQPVATD